jgi:hypothetical protein
MAFYWHPQLSIEEAQFAESAGFGPESTCPSTKEALATIFPQSPQDPRSLNEALKSVARHL